MRYWMGETDGGTALPDVLHAPEERATKDPTLASGPGVDLYLGGSEHAVGHLLYSRFWVNVLYDLGHCPVREPFRKLFHQGLITSYAYQRSDKSILAVDMVREVAEGQFVETATGEPVTPIVTKMSKRYKNVINPDDVIREHGADTFRLYEMYMGPLEASKPWNTRDIAGPHRFLQRVWRLVVGDDDGGKVGKWESGKGNTGTAADANKNAPAADPARNTPVVAASSPSHHATFPPSHPASLNAKLVESNDPAIEKLLHKTIKKVQSDIERLCFNTAIAAMMEFVNACYKAERVGRSQVERFLLVLSPFAPHIADELMDRMSSLSTHAGKTAPAGAPAAKAATLLYAAWPAYEEALTRDDEVEIAVQINGKVRGRMMAALDASEDELVAAALQIESVKRDLGDRPIRKRIVVKGRLLNLIA
jgi:leucyl-tRNA synthetase